MSEQPKERAGHVVISIPADLADRVERAWDESVAKVEGESFAEHLEIRRVTNEALIALYDELADCMDLPGMLRKLIVDARDNRRDIVREIEESERFAARVAKTGDEVPGGDAA